ncbi:MAG: dihydrolipoyl dehydrogenase, partial [Actinomycetota bacterium]|nr:dihydrolipoyl dehydrogenase [Actinomycetota bacterium]
DPSAIPEVVFADPEVAQLGVTPDQAAAVGIEATSFRFPYTAGSRSRTIGDTAGFVELVTDTDGTVIGGLLAGHGVSELAGEIALAIEMAATVEDVAATIRPHPTFSEGVTEAALGLLGRPLHVRR